MSATYPDNFDSKKPFGILADNYRDVVEMLEILSNVLPLPSIIETSHQVVSLPPEERFSQSHELVDNYFKSPDSKDISEEKKAQIKQMVGPVDKEEFLPRLHDFVAHNIQDGQQDILDRIIVDRENELGYLLLGLYLKKLGELFSELEFQRSGREIDDEIASGVFALLSRLVLVVTGEQSGPDRDMLRDIAWAHFILSKAKQNKVDRDLREAPIQEVEA